MFFEFAEQDSTVLRDVMTGDNVTFLLDNGPNNLVRSSLHIPWDEETWGRQKRREWKVEVGLGRGGEGWKWGRICCDGTFSGISVCVCRV